MMDFEVFYKKYEEGLLKEIADEAFKILTQPIPQTFLNEYDFLNLTIDFISYWEHYKDFDRIIQLQAGVQQNSELYANIRFYINEILIRYYCFTNNKAMIVSALNAYLQDEDINIELLMSSVLQVAYYGYIDIVDSFIENEYDHLGESDDVDVESLEDLAMIKFNIELDKAAATGFDQAAFTQKMSVFDFKLPNDILAIIKQAFELTINDDLKTKVLGKYREKKREEMLTLKIIFMKYMLDKQCPFVLSGVLWGYFADYWFNKEASSWLGYFTLKERSFQKFLENLNVLMPRKASSDALVLWGSRYIVEFIEALRLEQPTYYAPQKKMLTKLKTQFKKDYQADLWEFSFVHRWLPANDLLTQEHDAEKELFLASYNEEPEEFTPEDFQDQRQMMGDFMEAMNELMEEELSGDFFDDEYDEDEAFFDDPFGNEAKLDKRYSNKPVLPIQKKQTFRRNDKVTAKYPDGTVKKNVKFKTVQADFEKGLCEVEA
ncbi:hypothetical protein [uncultured Microscilla sp.]|uniref:hypothetical protein n=1 Tax=uncultured Microscilla sp. TaxID=432653 RepID=UPI002602B787|nr:hypothetical protein [uncultured Microscilla sp.]